MKLQLLKGVTSQTLVVFIQDSSSTTGAGLASLAWNTGSLTWHYYREGDGTGATSVTLATQTLGTWASGGFVEIDATNMPGWYEIGVPDLALATGADFVGMTLKGATNMAQVNIEVQLTDVDMNDGVRGGMTALPNAAADAAGGLVISDAGGLDIDVLAGSDGATLATTQGNYAPAKAGDAMALTTAERDSAADALLTRTDGVETGWTLQQTQRIIAAATAGKLSGAATTTNTMRGLTDASDRITSTVDADGNRSAVTYVKT